MFANMSSAPRLSVSSLTPKELRPGRAGGGGPLDLGLGAGAACTMGCETVRPLKFVVESTVPSGTAPTVNVFLLPNQLPLFLLFRLGAWLFIVAGEPGRSDLRLSDDERVRMPKNLRTELGRLLEGLVGDMVLAPSLVRLWAR